MSGPDVSQDAPAAGPPLLDFVGVASSRPRPTIEPPRVTPSAPVAPAASGQTPGLEELHASDLRLPHLKLRQERTSQAERVPEGSWFLTCDPDGHSLGREIVVLDLRKERALVLPSDEAAARAVVERIQRKTGFSVPLDDWAGAVCYSHDLVRPVERDGVQSLSPDCTSCPLGRWRTERGRRSRDCAEQYRVLVYDLATDMPATLLVRGAAVRPTLDVLTALRVACKREGRPSWSYSVSLLSRRVEGVTRPYYVPVFDQPVAIDDPKRVALLGELRALCALSPAEEESQDEGRSS